MDKRALKGLREHFTEVPGEAHNQNSWAENVPLGVIPSIKQHKKKYECGMQACLGGHAAIKFPNRLRLSKIYV